jgi:hypothetical protein
VETIDGDETLPSRCDSVIPLAETVVLERKNNRDMEKPRCNRCFEAVGVPKGYEVTYLER